MKIYKKRFDARLVTQPYGIKHMPYDTEKPLCSLM